MIKLPDEKQALIEWLKPQIAELENICDEIPFGLDEDDAMQLKVMRLALDSLNATAQPVSDGWIKCSERLPDDNGRYLVLFIWMNSGPPVVNIADFQHTAYETPIMTWNYPREARITHWMPLPAAPGGQDD